MNNVQCTSPSDESISAPSVPSSARPPQTMSAIVHDRYGPPDVLEHRVLPVPTPDDDQVVVRVEVASINPLDFHFMTGTPYLVRLVAGLRAPKQPTRGADVAGVVVAVGDAVSSVQVGDRVYGGARGSFAEYAVTKPKVLAAMPVSMSFAEAAALPVAAITAMQALRDQAAVRPGDRVLVIGASGGVGTYAVQIAKHLGGSVTGVCSGRNVDLVRSLGADSVIDYATTDSIGEPASYDVIIDNIGNRPVGSILAALAAGGRYVIVGGPKKGNWIGPFTLLIRSKLRFIGSKKRATSFTASETTEALDAVTEMVDAGAVRSVIDRTYPLVETADAMRYLMTGRIRGKVLIDPKGAR